MVKSVDKCPAYRTISAACDGSEKSMEKLLKFYDFEDKQKVLDAFGKVIKIANGNIEMTWNI